ncbi:MAG: sigma-70 family RNA polymerase sigma factor [Myxococcaceae bacterium]
MAAGTDSQLVADLYRRFGPAIHRRALALTKDPNTALDLTQETFLAYMQKRVDLRGDAQPFTVLYQIATYKAVDHLRARARWSGALGSLEVKDDEGEARAFESATAHEGGARQVEAAQDLALLTKGEEPEVLTAAYLYFVEAHTTEEVAQMLDLSRKTVGKMLQKFAERAKKRSARLGAEGT